MATGTAGTTARQFHQQMVHYIRKGFTFANAATTITVGILPAGAIIIHPISGLFVSQVFNAGTNNRVDIGASTDTGTNNYGTLMLLTALGVVPLDEGLTLSPKTTADTTVQAYIDVTGTPATTGAADIVIAYSVNNDG
jgi:hypothetical protein